MDMHYATKSLKQLFQAYAFENDRTNQEDAAATKKGIVLELERRVRTSLMLLESASEADVEQIYRQFIEH